MCQATLNEAQTRIFILLFHNGNFDERARKSIIRDNKLSNSG